uniref:Regulatory protein zeste n=1 Tax=Bactrocera latifrons TaxID=174628 RepID=A0A0K8V970_BACLA
MAEKSLLKITNGKQFERLVHLMQKNPQIARGARTYGQSKQQVEEQWNKIADELNNFGPPCRTGKEWQRVWINYKAKTKKKMSDEHFQPYPLTKLEQTVAALLQAEFGDSFGAVSDEPPSASNSFSSAIKEPTKDQYTLLLQEIERKPEVGKHTPAFGPPRNQEDWERIAKKLNAIGPPERSIREWKKNFP